MLLRTLLRTSAALYVIPFLILFVMTAIARDLTAWTTAGYWPSATGSSLHSLPFICTIAAGLGAWEGARLAQGRVFGQTAARSRLSITAPVLAPVVVGALLTSLAALLLSADAAGVGAGLPDLQMLLVVFLMVVMNTLLGFCAGLRWRAVISVPVVLVGAFFLNAYPVSWSILWIRHLIGEGSRTAAPWTRYWTDGPCGPSYCSPVASSWPVSSASTPVRRRAPSQRSQPP